MQQRHSVVVPRGFTIESHTIQHMNSNCTLPLISMPPPNFAILTLQKKLIIICHQNRKKVKYFQLIYPYLCREDYGLVFLSDWTKSLQTNSLRITWPRINILRTISLRTTWTNEGKKVILSIDLVWDY